MVRASRPRRFVSRGAIVLLRPFFRFSSSRDAYVLRLIGDTHGPVLRPERRRVHRAYDGPERRRAGAFHG